MCRVCEVDVSSPRFEIFEYRGGPANRIQGVLGKHEAKWGSADVWVCEVAGR